MRKLLGVLLIMLLVAAVLPARDLDSDGFDNNGNPIDSPTNDTTGSRFESDFDNYLDPGEWGTLESNVLFLQFDGPEGDGDTQFQAGTGLFLGNLYFGGFIGSQLPQTSADNFERQENSAGSQLFIENGEVVAIQEDVESQVDEDRNQDTEFKFVVGASFGDIEVGLKNTLDREQNNDIGTLGVDFGDNWRNADNVVDGGTNDDWFWDALRNNAEDPFQIDEPQTNTRSTVTNAAGEETFQSINEYDEEGFDNDQSFNNWTTLAANLPVGPINLRSYLYFGYRASNMDGESAQKESTTYFDANLPEYNGVQNAQSVTEQSGTVTNSFAKLTPGIFLEAAYMVSETVEVTGGVGYNFTFRTDDPKTWEYDYEEYEVTSFDGTYLNTETGEYTLDAEAAITETDQVIEVPIGITVRPTDRFAYSVGYTPRFELGSMETEYSGTIELVNTVAYGDPDLQDTVTTSTGVVESVKVTEETRKIQHTLNLGAQFFLRENFRVNLGSTLQANSLDETVRSQDASDDNSYTVVEQIGDNDPVTTTSNLDETYAEPESGRDEESVVNNPTNPSSDYELGFTYFFSEKMELDVAYRTGTLGPNSDSNIFNLGVWSALMTIRY